MHTNLSSFRSDRHFSMRLAAGVGAFLVPIISLAAPLSVTVLDSAGAPLPDSIISIEVRGERQQAEAGTTAEMAQRGRTFVPKVVVVQTGTALKFPNFDTVRHHVYSFSSIKPFEIKLYSGTPAAPLVFDKPGVAVLGCNIHDRMTGFVYVVNTARFASSRADGVAMLDVPVGEHTLQVWHPGLSDQQPPLRQQIKVTGAADTAVTVRLGSVTR